MRRLVATLALLLAAFVAAFPQAGVGTTAAASSGGIDLVVMVDTSESMFPYFDDLRDYLLSDLLKQKLHRGDTFHLLSFDSTPEVETSVQLASSDAAEKAFGRLQLLHPLGRYTDLIAALRFLREYVRKLPEANPKTILILTDGIHDPPPGSPWRLPADQVAAAVRQEAEAIAREGWTVQLLKVPAQPDGEDQKLPSYLEQIAEALGTTVVPYDSSRKAETTGMLTGYPTLSFPADLGEVGRRFRAPFTVKNYRSEPFLVRLTSVEATDPTGESFQMLERPVEASVPAGGEAVLEAAIDLPRSFAAGPHLQKVHLSFSDDLRISPVDGTLAFTFTGKAALLLPRFSWLYVVYLLAAAAVIYGLVRLFLLMRRKLHETSLEGLARVTALGRAGPEETDGQQLDGRQLDGRQQHGGQPGAGGPGVPARAGAAAPLRATGGQGAAPGARGLGLRRGKVALLSVGRPSPAAEALATTANRRVAPTVQSVRRALPVPKTAQGGLPPLIEMRVGQQNSRIGMRNVHRILAGGGRSVGGRASSFLIFLHRVPRGIAEIRNVEGRYTFVPVRKEFFPAVPGPLEDCFGRQIALVGRRGQPMTLEFRQWVSALDEINALMRSVRRD